VVEPPIPPPLGAMADPVMAMPHLRGATAPTTVPNMSDGDGVNGVGPAADTEAGAAAGVRDGDAGNERPDARTVSDFEGDCFAYLREGGADRIARSAARCA
jgi:hypothetical protein